MIRRSAGGDDQGLALVSKFGVKAGTRRRIISYQEVQPDDEENLQYRKPIFELSVDSNK